MSRSIFDRSGPDLVDMYREREMRMKPAKSIMPEYNALLRIAKAAADFLGDYMDSKKELQDALLELERIRSEI